jgi:hypothetical protein
MHFSDLKDQGNITQHFILYRPLRIQHSKFAPFDSQPGTLDPQPNTSLDILWALSPLTCGEVFKMKKTNRRTATDNWFLYNNYTISRRCAAQSRLPSPATAHYNKDIDTNNGTERPQFRKQKLKKINSDVYQRRAADTG